MILACFVEKNEEKIIKRVSFNISDQGGRPSAVLFA
jgi:hypothetical protein